MELDDKDIFDTSQLNFDGDFDRQVSEVLYYVQLKQQQFAKIHNISSDLYHTLGGEWENIKITTFGSIVTGLAMKSSDVDFYIELPIWMYPPEKSFVLRAKSVLMQNQRIFQRAFAIINAKVPIVQFYHVPSGMYCDISFNSSAGVENSKLLAHLLQDNKALRLAILVKYWSKVHNLTGKNLMPNYCLTLLVLFFLQQCNFIDTVADLQANIQERCIDRWNVAFETKPNNKTITKPLYHLLGEFFKYYKTFEYETYIISPFLGTPIKREFFSKVETIPMDFPRYKDNVGTKKCDPIRLDCVMCVQDPFEHNRNCALPVHRKFAQTFLSQVQVAAAVYESNDEKSFLEKLLGKEAENSSIANKKQKRALHRGVTKPYRRNQNLRKFIQHTRDFRQNYYTGRNQTHWR